MVPSGASASSQRNTGNDRQGIRKDSYQNAHKAAQAQNDNHIARWESQRVMKVAPIERTAHGRSTGRVRESANSRGTMPAQSPGAGASPRATVAGGRRFPSRHSRRGQALPLAPQSPGAKPPGSQKKALRAADRRTR